MPTLRERLEAPGAFVIAAELVTSRGVMAQHTGQALHEIIRMSDEVGNMVAQIATAASQQQEATSLVTANITQISTLTHQSSVNASETAQASTELAKLANHMQEIVNNICV